MDISIEARRATQLTVVELFRKQAIIRSGRIACRQDDLIRSYAELDRRTTKLGNALLANGLKPGDRIAILSENSAAFLDLFIAAAKVGVILASQNWRLSGAELAHCFSLVEPALCFVSERFRTGFDAATEGRYTTVDLGAEYEAFVDGGAEAEISDACDPENGLLIVYTSGTTGLPKGAVISQRALIARAQQYCTEFGFDSEDTFYAYSPMFHIASADLALATLMIGGTVIVSDGLKPQLLRQLLQDEKLSNLIFFPGMVSQVLEELSRMTKPVRSLKKFGALADLFPPQEIAAMTTALGKEYCNTFASTETGMMPACGGRIPVGVAPTTFSKTESNFCLVRLVDDEGRDVADGETGEMVTRGPTLFSGYWRNEAATEEVFRDAWYHTGDLFRRNPDGTLDYVDRKKYLVKSGGENIYPAEIERVVLQMVGVEEALVVRRSDKKWGEVPVLVVTVGSADVMEAGLMEHCRAHLARYKCPKGIYFVPRDFWPRNNTGKIVRREVEDWVAHQPRDVAMAG